MPGYASFDYDESVRTLAASGVRFRLPRQPLSELGQEPTKAATEHHPVPGIFGANRERQRMAVPPSGIGASVTSPR
jgi:hypothetical protein